MGGGEEVTSGNATTIQASDKRRVETETETKLECPIPFSRLWSVLYPLPPRVPFVKAGKVEHTHMELSRHIFCSDGIM